MNICQMRLKHLGEREKQLKHEYLNGGRKYMEEPMTFAQYISYIEDELCIEDPLSTYYREKSKDKLGNTIDDVGLISNENEIAVVLHDRYSYPVWHNHSYVEIIYVYNGSCKHFVEDETFEMRKGDLCVLAPNSKHTITVTDDDTVVVNVLLSKKLFSNAFLELLRGDQILIQFFENVLYNKTVNSYIVFPTADDRQIRECFEGMCEESVKTQYAYEKLIKLYMEAIFINLIRKYVMMAKVASTIDSTKDTHIVAILGYLSVNYYRVNLTETAEFFGYSSTYLSRMLKQQTGKNFTRIITELQVQNAIKLLEEGKLNITEISQEVGCFDISHLNKKFKKIYGVSLEMYKKNQKNQ